MNHDEDDNQGDDIDAADDANGHDDDVNVPGRVFGDVDEAMLDVLAAGGSHRAAGAVVHRSAKFVQRRLWDADFRAEVARRRSVYLDAQSGRLASLGERAVQVLEGALGDDEPGIRLRAAQLVLSWSARLRHEVDIEVRLARLEAAESNVEVH